MEAAWNEKNFDEIARLAHWLKGAGGTVGFDAFTEPAAELEQLAKAKNEDQIAAMLTALRRLAARIEIANPANAQAVVGADKGWAEIAR